MSLTPNVSSVWLPKRKCLMAHEHHETEPLYSEYRSCRHTWYTPRPRTLPKTNITPFIQTTNKGTPSTRARSSFFLRPNRPPRGHGNLKRSKKLESLTKSKQIPQFDCTDITTGEKLWNLRPTSAGRGISAKREDPGRTRLYS